MLSRKVRAQGNFTYLMGKLVRSRNAQILSTNEQQLQYWKDNTSELNMRVVS